MIQMVDCRWLVTLDEDEEDGRDYAVIGWVCTSGVPCPVIYWRMNSRALKPGEWDTMLLSEQMGPGVNDGVSTWDEAIERESMST